ncbi:hypothetical protein ACHWQZ_G004434 [Mnemiopsis leidyi]
MSEKCLLGPATAEQPLDNIATKSTTDSSDSTDLFQMETSLPARVILAIWSLTVMTFCVFGNLFVLLSSLRKKSIKLDRVSVTIIRNIALVDIGFSVSIGLTLVSIIHNSWPFGHLICVISNYWSLYFGISEICLICSLNLSKLIILLNPLRAKSRKKIMGVFISSAMWIIPLFNVIPNIFLGRLVEFRLSFFRCEGYFEGQFFELMPLLSVVLFMLVPMMLVAVGIVWLLLYVRKVCGLHRQGIVTILGISTCYFLSFLPWGLFYILRGPLNLGSNIYVAVYYYRFATFATFTNFAANPIIYYVSLKSFREYSISTGQLLRSWMTERFSSVAVMIHPRFESHAA